MVSPQGLRAHIQDRLAYEPGVKDQIEDIAMNGGGIRDTARILGIGKSTVISTLKKVR